MRYFEIENPVVCEITGQDATRYLNARLTQDIKKLEVGASTVAAALTPQGKTQALVLVWRIDEQRYFLSTDAGNPEEILQAIKRYIVADRVFGTLSEQYAVFHTLPDIQERTLAEFCAIEDLPTASGNISVWKDGFITVRDRGFGPGYELLIQRDAAIKFRDFLASRQAYLFSRSDIAYSRILARIPAYPEELNEQLLFSEARYKNAIASNKGCYVGQEVVERVESMGKTAQVLQVVECESCTTFMSGEPVQTMDGASIGTVLSSAWNPQNNRTFGFVRVKNDRSFAGMSVKIGADMGILRWMD